MTQYYTFGDEKYDLFDTFWTWSYSYMERELRVDLSLEFEHRVAQTVYCDLSDELEELYEM